MLGRFVSAQMYADRIVIIPAILVMATFSIDLKTERTARLYNNSPATMLILKRVLLVIAKRLKN